MTRFRAGLSVSVNQYCFNYLVGINGDFYPSVFSIQAVFYLVFWGEQRGRGKCLFYGKMDAFEAKVQRRCLVNSDLKKKKSLYAVMNIQPCAQKSKHC